MEEVEFDTDLDIAAKVADLSWKKFREHKITAIFPLLSSILNLSLIYLILIVFETDFYLGVILLYFVMNFIVIFLNSSLVAYIKIEHEGDKPTIFKGMKFALRKIDKILWWSFYQATVGYFFGLLSSNKVLKWFVFAAEIAWALVTYFVVPILIIEDKTVSEAITGSKNFIKKYWSDGLRGEFILSIGFGIILFLILVTFFGVIYAGYYYYAKYVFVGGLLISILLIIVNSALLQIYNTSLYLYIREKNT